MIELMIFLAVFVGLFALFMKAGTSPVAKPDFDGLDGIGLTLRMARSRSEKHIKSASFKRRVKAAIKREAGKR